MRCAEGLAPPQGPPPGVQHPVNTLHFTKFSARPEGRTVGREDGSPSAHPTSRAPLSTANPRSGIIALIDASKGVYSRGTPDLDSPPSTYRSRNTLRVSRTLGRECHVIVILAPECLGDEPMDVPGMLPDPSQSPSNPATRSTQQLAKYPPSPQTPLLLCPHV